MAEDVGLTQEEVNLASQQEENVRLESQIRHFSERVVVLRAMVNHQEAEIAALKEALKALESKEEVNDRADD